MANFAARSWLLGVVVFARASTDGAHGEASDAVCSGDPPPTSCSALVQKRARTTRQRVHEELQHNTIGKHRKPGQHQKEEPKASELSEAALKEAIDKDATGEAAATTTAAPADPVKETDTVVKNNFDAELKMQVHEGRIANEEAMIAKLDEMIKANLTAATLKAVDMVAQGGETIKDAITKGVAKVAGKMVYEQVEEAAANGTDAFKEASMKLANKTLKDLLTPAVLQAVKHVKGMQVPLYGEMRGDAQEAIEQSPVALKIYDEEVKQATASLAKSLDKATETEAQEFVAEMLPKRIQAIVKESLTPEFIGQALAEDIAKVASAEDAGAKAKLMEMAKGKAKADLMQADEKTAPKVEAKDHLHHKKAKHARKKD